MKDREETTLKRIRAHTLFKRRKIDKGRITERRQRPADNNVGKRESLFMPNIEKKRAVSLIQAVVELSDSESDEDDRLLAKHIPLSERLKPNKATTTTASKPPERNMDRLKRTHGYASKPYHAVIKTSADLLKRLEASNPTTTITNPINILDDDSDDFSVSDLDDPDVISPWKPKQTIFRWKVGDTVEVAPLGQRNKDTLTDFCTIVGTNQDGTYNLQDIISNTYKKCVPENRIIGNYEDLFHGKEKTSQSKTKKDKSAKVKNQESDSDYDGDGECDSDSDSDDDDDYRVHKEEAYV